MDLSRRNLLAGLGVSAVAAGSVGAVSPTKPAWTPLAGSTLIVDSAEAVDAFLAQYVAEGWKTCASVNPLRGLSGFCDELARCPLDGAGRVRIVFPLHRDPDLRQ